MAVVNPPPPPPAPRLKQALFVLPALAFLGLLAFATLSEGSVPRPGDPAPAFEAPLLESRGVFALSDARGEPVFVNFWWSGCEPCKEEAPLLSRAHEAYGDRVRFIGINIRDAKSDALAFAAAQDLDFTHVRDEDLSIYERYGLSGQPESFFIDGEGVIVEHITGPLSETLLTQLLDLLVARGG